MCFNFFKIRKKRQIAVGERLLAEKKVLDLKKQVQLVEERAGKLANSLNSQEHKKKGKSDSTCPKCGSKKVNERIKRQQGEINGEIHGESWSALTFGRGYLDGSIKGSLDTNEVNKCNDCGHEWKKYILEYKWSRDILKKELDYVYYLLQDHYEVKDVTFDPTNLSEKFNSLEEKKADKLKSADYWLNTVNEFWSNDYLDVLIYLVKNNMDPYTERKFFEYYDEGKLLLWGFRKYPDNFQSATKIQETESEQIQGKSRSGGNGGAD